MPQKLLLADDSVTIQRVIELTFADEDVQVLAVGDGRQAIDRITAERPDIVLADVGMPGCDGYEVCSFVKQAPELAHIPVLLLTGAFEPVDEARATASRCDGVLAKPFEPQQLISKVKTLLTGRTRPVAAPSAPTPAPTPVPDLRTSAAIGAGPGVADQLGAAPPAASDRNTPAEDLDLLAPVTPRDRSSLDDYFDRLDAAFANLASGASAAPPPDEAASDFSIDDVPWGGVAQGEAGGKAKPADVPLVGLENAGPPPAQQPLIAPSVVAPNTTEAASVERPLAVPQLFSALLDAEHGVSAPLEAGGSSLQVPIEPDQVSMRPEIPSEQSTTTFINSVAERAVREVVERIVRDVAERVVREEVARLKERIEAAQREANT